MRNPLDFIPAPNRKPLLLALLAWTLVLAGWLWPKDTSRG